MSESQLVTIEHAESLVGYWAPRFGFGHYDRLVTPLAKPEADAEEWSWAQCTWMHDDEFFEVLVMPDVLPLEQAEGAIIHEFAHGLLELATTSDTAEEIVCNRIVKLLKGSEAKPNWYFYKTFGHDGKLPRHETTIPRELYLRLVSVLVDGLSPVETEVLNALFWERTSLRVAGERLGYSARNIGRIRDHALARIQAALEDAEQVTANV